MGIRIDPAQECSAAGRGGNQSRTGTGHIHLAAGSHSIAGNGDAAQGAVILESDRRGLLDLRNGKAAHDELVGGAVLCGDDGDGKALTGLHDLLEAAAGTGIRGTVDLQLVDGGGSPVE